MINNEQKKWFLYSHLPTEGLNKLFIYMPTENWPECEKALWLLEEYLADRFDTIGKVSRIDMLEEDVDFSAHPEIKYPILVFEGQYIQHDHNDIVKRVDEYLPKFEHNSELQKKLKALKDGKDLL